MTTTETTMAPRTATFDLLDEPWLPVSLLDGRAETWSLLDLFTHAHEARGLSEPSPLTFTASMRFLLAILHRAYEGPANAADWAEIREAGQFDRTLIASYLNRYRHRFDLFHPERPFAQTPGIAGKAGDEKPITQLTFERVSGNNGTLYDHSVDESPLPVSPGDAARLVLTAHQYGFAGAQIFRDTPMIAGYCLMLEGASLFETLVLNLQQYDDQHPGGLDRRDDAPWWERDTDPEADPAGNQPLGLTDLLTWRGRRILLVRDEDGLVRHCWYRPGYQLRPGDTIDPFKRCVPVMEGDQERGWFPRGFLLDKALWRDSYAFFPKEYAVKGVPRSIPRPTIISWLDQVRAHYDENRDDPLAAAPSLVATGIVKATQATVQLWRMDRQPMPLGILRDPDRGARVEDAIEYADQARMALRTAASTYAKHVVGKGVRDPAPEDVSRELASLRFEARYWSALDLRFQSFLTDLERDDPDEALDNWRRILRRVATDTYFDATDQTNTDGLRMAGQAMGSQALKRQLAKALGKQDGGA